MTINPKINPIVVKVLFSMHDSGKSSEPTTEIIAPAENAKSIGKTDLAVKAAKAPKTPAIGSTNPESCP